MVSMCVMARAALKTSAGASAPSGAVGAIESVDAIATSTRAASAAAPIHHGRRPCCTGGSSGLTVVAAGTSRVVMTHQSASGW